MFRRGPKCSRQAIGNMNSNSSNENPTDPLFKVLDEQEVTAMVAAFYGKVREDAVIGPMYPPDDWEGAEKRLRDFLIYRFGGSDRYIQERGHPRLGMRHAPFPIGMAERDRWLQLMEEAMDEVDISESSLQMVKDFFRHVAEFLRNR